MVVDDFGVKYVGEEHVNHLKAILEEHYKLTWLERYKIHWNQIGLGLQETASASINAKLWKEGVELKQFQHIVNKMQHAPYPSVPIQ